jgi:hypothetical protein
MLPHRNVDKYTRIFTDGETHNQTDHIFTDRRGHSSALGVWPFRGADRDTNHYLVVAKVKEISAGNKNGAQKFDGERFNPRKLNELEDRKQNQIKISKRLAT